MNSVRVALQVVHIPLSEDLDNWGQKIQNWERNGWQVQPEESQNKVDGSGRLYKPIMDLERSFSCVARVARFVLGLLAVLATLGLALLAQPVRNLFVAEKAVRSLRIYFDRVSAEEIQHQNAEQHLKDEEEIWKALNPREIAKIDLTKIASPIVLGACAHRLKDSREFAACVLKLTGKEVCEMLPRMPFYLLDALLEQHIEYIRETLRHPAPEDKEDSAAGLSDELRRLNWFEKLFTRDSSTPLGRFNPKYVADKLGPEFYSLVLSYATSIFSGGLLVIIEELSKAFHPERIGHSRLILETFQNLPPDQLKLLSAKDSFTDQHWLWLTQAQKKNFDFSQLSEASARSFFAAMDQQPSFIDAFPAENLEQIPDELLTADQGIRLFPYFPSEGQVEILQRLDNAEMDQSLKNDYLARIFSQENIDKFPSIQVKFGDFSSERLKILSATDSFTTSHWQRLTAEQRQQFDFSQLSQASVISFFAALDDDESNFVSQFSQEQLQQIPDERLTASQREKLKFH